MLYKKISNVISDRYMISCFTMMALAGTIQGNTVIIDDDSITNYDGKDVILTILDHQYKTDRKKINGDKYGIETERGRCVEEYMEEIRNNDRI